MNGIMLDIETLGTTPGSVILSVGAAEFSNTEILNTCHVHIDPLDSASKGMHIDAATVMWWLAQAKEAQQALLDTVTIGLEAALIILAQSFDWTDKKVWCNGAAFDFPLLSAAHNAVGMRTPWMYYNEMDMRTVKGLVGKAVFKRCRIEPAIAHDGLADAIAQAKTLQNIFSEVSGGLQWAA